MSDKFEVDTAKVRKAAEDVKRIANSVQGLSDTQVRKMREVVQENLAGASADALSSVLTELSTDIQKIAGALQSVQARLKTYAADVEEADRRSAEAMRS